MNEIERHKLIKKIFDEALEIGKENRSKYLDEVCQDDTALRKEVESLLASFENSENFIENPATDFKDIFVDDKRIGQKIGNYKIIREIGHGGMGAVYFATRTDGEFEQQVAVKVIRQTFADKELLRRFKDERQILAKLQHSNIASLIDGGVSVDGQPFLAMEFIDGISITDYCQANNLSLKERLKLFLKVCKGVGYAHRNLIVHRDIKPSNILVNKENEPKLLDFGLAKLTVDNADSSQTKTAFRALTPAYASPEQLKGETITTASDIYSLGICLYEVLTGTRPFQTDGKSLEEIIRTVTQVEPILPSKLESSSSKLQNLNREIDNIVAYSLRKEPERRYQSVEEFAKDIENYLDGLPVIARPNTFSYRTEKFFKRNKIAVVAASLIILSLLGGLFVSLRQTRIAQAETAKSQKITKFMEKVLNYANPAWYAEGSKKQGEAKLIEVIDDLADKIETEFPDNLEIQAELNHKFAEIYQAKLNKTEALFHAKKALELRRRVYGENHVEVAKDLYYLSAAEFSNGNIIESTRLGDEAIIMFYEVDADNPNLPYLLDDQANIRFSHYSDTTKSEKYFTEALEMFRKKDGENHYNTARMLINLSKVFAKKGELAKSDEFYREGENRFKQLSDENTKKRFIRYQGEFLQAKGDFVGFETLLENRLAEMTKNGEGESLLAIYISNNLGNHYGQTSNFEKMIERAKFTLDLENRKPFPDKDLLGSHKAEIAYCLLRLGKESEAKPYFEEAFQQFKQSDSEILWIFEKFIGKYLFYLKRYDEAEPYLQNALIIYNKNYPPSKEHKELAELLEIIRKK
jgi:eukaryotic-like serine/threonine-protein kinase